MNKLTLIALLLAAIATNMAGGFESHKRRSQHRLARYGVRRAETYLDCKEEYGVSDDDSEKFMQSIGGPMEMDTPLLKCIAGCLFQSLEIIVDCAFNKRMYASIQCEKNACEAADQCETIITDVPKDLCSLGGAILQQCNVTNFRMYHDEP